MPTAPRVFDVEVACSGFLYAQEIGRQFIATGSFDTVLVVGAEKLSDVTDWEDRTTCVLFGDGAGAVVLQPCEPGQGIITSVLGSDGSLADLLKIPGGGSRCPMTAENIDSRLQYMKMNGREVYKHAVRTMSDAAVTALKQCNESIDDVSAIIPHQANARIIQAIAHRLKFSQERVFTNMEHYGNMSAASVVVALDEAARSEFIKSGDLVVMIVFGGGFTWATTVVRW